MSDCTGLPSRSPEEKKISVDLAIVNGNIITVDDKNPHAEALAVKNERIVIVGSNSAIQETIGRNSTVIDAQGKTITPGFIDAHLHPIPLYDYKSIQHELQVGPAVVKTIDDLVAALARKAKITPKGEWVWANRYDEVAMGRHPTRYDLDRASTEHPIYVGHVSGHIGVANSKALADAKITRNTPNPEGGHMIAIKMEN